MQAESRKVIVTVEEVQREGGKPVEPPIRRAAAIAGVQHPYAGRYVGDLSPMFDLGDEPATLLSARAVEALGIPGDQVYSYGKAAIVGSDGESEHCAAILHPKFGKPLRAQVGGDEAIIPSAAKRGGPGTAIDVPLPCKDDEGRCDSFDAMEVRGTDAPVPHEIVVACVVTTAGLPHARVGTGRIL